MSNHTSTDKMIARTLPHGDLMRTISTLRRRVTQARLAGNGPAMVTLLDQLEVYTNEFRSRA
jgi:hypothetical protein